MHILETPRLILRSRSHSDDLLLDRLHSDRTLEESKTELLGFINHWRHNRFGLWMVSVKVAGQVRRLAGYCGFMCSVPNLPDGSNNVVLVCFNLAASGKWIAERMEHFGLEKVTAFIRTTNTRSIRLAKM
ncbi:GNAT family protein [Mesorhizobium sp. M0590]|uniref:GNAT family N-acetyltransferase n=1 Tax=Mesorhizobium sp. M0590 TaxID=2956966 RepID=UPI00333C24B7